MRVFPERMLRNLESTHGLVFSGQLLQDLVEKGMPRDDAYKAVQENAMAAWESESSFRDRLQQTRASPNTSMPRHLLTLSICGGNCGMWTPSSTGSSARILPGKKPWRDGRGNTSAALTEEFRVAYAAKTKAPG